MWQCALFPRKYDLICLFIGIRIKMHFPLECPLTYFLQVRIQFIPGVVNIKNLKKKKCHHQRFCIEKLSHLVIRLCKLKTRVDLTPILEEHQIESPSNRKFDHLKLPFFHSYLGSFLVEKIAHLQHHMILI